MDLLQSFKNSVAGQRLFSSEDRLLLAVSGGVDSVALCELCYRAGFDFIIAHCNFQLRGAESDRDEEFVRQLAKKYGKELLVRSFDTAVWAEDHKVSLQVAARRLRYDWFHEIMTAPPHEIPTFNIQHSTFNIPKFLLTAHHLDDNVETLLMNFFKGTGIAGLRAMLPRQGGILRPLLFAQRQEILQFAVKEGLEWVEDSSNTSDKYTRNYFRHQVIPLLQQVYPGALDNLADNIPRFREIEQLYRQSVEQHKKRLLEYKGDEIHIPVLKLKRSAPLTTLVYEIIHEFGFTPQQVGGVIDLLDSGSGKYIRSATHRILKNRSWLIISRLEPTQAGPAVHILIESPADTIRYSNGQLSFEVSSIQNLKFNTQNNNTALLDAASIRFPLLLRKWRQGDYFYPLGLRKKKKLGRFFIDNRLSLADKEKVWVIEADKKIIWVVGLRIDDRFRITPHTRTTLIIKAEPGLA